MNPVETGVALLRMFITITVVFIAFALTENLFLMVCVLALGCAWALGFFDTPPWLKELRKHG
jgi:hypothetical protein